MNWHLDLTQPRPGDSEFWPKVKPDEVVRYQVRAGGGIPGDTSAFTIRAAGPRPTELYEFTDEMGNIVAEVYPDDWQQESDDTWIFVITTVVPRRD